MVEIARAGLRVERGTRLVITKLFEAGFRFFGFIEQASRSIAGEIRGEAADGFLRASFYTLGAGRIALPKFAQALLQTRRIQKVNLEHTVTALGAAGAAR